MSQPDRSGIRLLCVADDFTGAGDAAGMFAAGGARCVLLTRPCERRQCAGIRRRADVVVIATRQRLISPTAAARSMRERLEALRPLGAKQFQLKCSSTFDSTSRGNIGPAIDAALAWASADVAFVVAALPVNGRTTYMGHHFVDGVLLSESPMKDHPLTPMREANLVRHLQGQTRHRVGLVAHPYVSAGPKQIARRVSELHAEGYRVLIFDALTDKDMQRIAQAALSQPVLAGSSGLSFALARKWHARGDPAAPRPTSGPVLAVAGSCSEATRRQNTLALEAGWTGLPIPVEKLITSQRAPRRLIRELGRVACERLGAERNVLLFSSAEPSAVKRVLSVAKRVGLEPSAAGERLSRRTGLIVRDVMGRVGVQRLIVAGGETAGGVVEALGLRAFDVGPQIDPGVPLCWTIGRKRLAVALKSGNFGTDDFYLKAFHMMQKT